MNFIEAIGSGKPVKRTNKSTWFMRNEWWFGSNKTACNTLGDGYIAPEILLDSVVLRKEDILAEDWSVRENK